MLEEADECVFWLELIMDAKIMHHDELDNLMREANELIAIFVATLKTAKIKTL